MRGLLLALFGLGTNLGIRAIVATGEHGESEAALRRVRRHFITVDNLRVAVTKLVHAAFAARGGRRPGGGVARTVTQGTAPGGSPQATRRSSR
ncbi:Tn3 family transposase [Streptomyces sp. Edi2]|uniref:Tn3 family transposase n=1 Tax=Streptomyces sp. Edi2 TaxID=3162528 RepID=UPI0033064EB9